MGEKVLICFSKDTVVTDSARKLKNSILGSTLYWFPKKRRHWNTGIHGHTYHNDTFLRNNNNGKTEQRKLNNFITLLGCVMLVAFLYPRLQSTARTSEGTSVNNITQINKLSLYLYVYFIKTGLDMKKGPVMNRSVMELIYLLEARSILR